MTIILEHISKRFQKHWIFKDVNYSFAAGGTYALLGANGSGKSTLLRVVAGMQSPSLGKVHFALEGAAMPVADAFHHISFSAPGMELVEELTLGEFFDFHFSFKKPMNGLSSHKIIEMIGLKLAADKPIGDYSSGMKQRVKLAQAIFADTEVLLLDEPCTNLDQAGVEQYKSWIEHYAANRMVVVASNDPREYFFCRETLALEQYK